MSNTPELLATYAAPVTAVYRDGSLHVYRGDLAGPPVGDVAFTFADDGMPTVQQLWVAPADCDLTQARVHAEGVSGMVNVWVLLPGRGPDIILEGGRVNLTEGTSDQPVAVQPAYRRVTAGEQVVVGVSQQMPSMDSFESVTVTLVVTAS